MLFFESVKGLLKRKLPEHFCIAPFVQMDLHEQGRVNACCKAKDKLGDWSEKRISEIWNDQPMRKLRREFIEGKKPRGCSTCWTAEEKGITSRRQNYNETLNDELKDIEMELRRFGKVSEERPLRLRSLDVGFGAQCSLRCRMCGPSASSKWLSTALNDRQVYEYFTNLGELNPRVVDTGFKDFLSNELFEDFASNIAPNVGDLMISGGEPMNSENHFRLFQHRLSDSQLSQMKVTLTTNAQTTEFRGISLIPRWQKLRYFVYRVSIDGVGEAYPYVRSGGELEKVVNSIQTVRDAFSNDVGKLQVVAAIAVSMYNITRLPEIIDFASSRAMLIHFNWVHFPKFLSIENLSGELRDKSIARLTAKREEILSDDYWKSHDFWSQNLDLDRNFKIFQEYLIGIKGLNEKMHFTYRDYARAKYLDEIDNALSALMKVDGKARKKNEFREHVHLFDRINSSNFLSVFPEFKTFMDDDSLPPDSNLFS